MEEVCEQKREELLVQKIATEVIKLLEHAQGCVNASGHYYGGNGMTFMPKEKPT